MDFVSFAPFAPVLVLLALIAAAFAALMPRLATPTPPVGPQWITYRGRRMPLIAGADPVATPADIVKLFNEFREKNDQRLAEIEKNGEASAETNARVDALNTAITELQARLNRPNRGGGSSQPTDQQMHYYAQWQSQATRKPVDVNDVDLELIRNYSNEFRVYARTGLVGPVMASMSVGSDPDGGYMVSPDTGGRMIEYIRESSPVRRLAFIETTSKDALEGVYDVQRAGAVEWVGETQAPSESSTPQIWVYKIPVGTAACEPRATQQIIDDADRDVEAWLTGKVAMEFALDEATQFVNGTGVIKPRGFMTYAAGTPAVTSPAAFTVIQQVNSGHATLAKADGLIELVGSMKAAYRPGAVLGMARATETACRIFKDGNGAYLWQPDITRPGGSTLLGFPVEQFEDMPAVGANTLPIVFANFKAAYTIVDRQGIRVLRDPYTAKPYVKFYTTRRLGGDVVNFDAIKIQKIAA